MQSFDTIVLVIVLIAGFSGWRKGLATQITSIVALAAASFVSVRYPGLIAEKIEAVPPYNGYAAMLILFLGTAFAVWLVSRPIHSSIDKMKLGGFDHQIGMLFGAIKGFALASVLTLVAFGFLGEPTRHAIVHQSKSGQLIAGFLHRAHPYVPAFGVPYVGPFFDRLEEVYPSTTVPGAVQVNNGYSPGNYPSNQTYTPNAPNQTYTPSNGFPPNQPPNQQPVYQPPYGQSVGQPPNPGTVPSTGSNPNWGQQPQTSGNPDWNFAPPRR